MSLFSICYDLLCKKPARLPHGKLKSKSKKNLGFLGPIRSEIDASKPGQKCPETFYKATAFLEADDSLTKSTDEEQELARSMFLL